ncbi:MAG: PHP domain-containing protein [Proteobacteria bacterium]|nr:PHP domain-containing protein [Pseudomonadota bacterium]
MLDQRLHENNLHLYRADCHCHTTFSDGSLNVHALLDLAKEKNLQGLSITDHDTIDAYASAIPYAKSLGITLVSGIEISTELERTPIHVLGYAFNLQYPGLKTFCQQLQQEREKRNEKILERLAKFKMPISLQELRATFGNGTIGRPHIAKMMVTKGYVKSMKQAFARYLGDKGRCYVGGYQVEVQTAIELIQQAGGYAVLAHPHYIQAKKHLSKLLTMPFDGIEAYYGHLGIKQVQPWLDIAMQKNWLITGGSDFHGEKKLFHSLGCSWTPQDSFKLLIERYNNHS